MAVQCAVNKPFCCWSGGERSLVFDVWFFERIVQNTAELFPAQSMSTSMIGPHDHSFCEFHFQDHQLDVSNWMCLKCGTPRQCGGENDDEPMDLGAPTFGQTQTESPPAFWSSPRYGHFQYGLWWRPSGLCHGIRAGRNWTHLVLG